MSRSILQKPRQKSNHSLIHSEDAISPASFLKNHYFAYLLAALFSLLLPIILYHYRTLDNNALCRWPWVFADGPPLKSWALLLIITLVAFFLASRSWPKNKPVFLFLSALIIGVSLWGEPEIIMDASRYFTQAKYLEVNGISAFWHGWGNELSAWTDLPLVPFIYGLVLTVFGETRIFIQALTTLFFVGSVWFTYLLARDLWDEETGLLAGLLLLCYPYLLLNIPLMMVDLPTMFFMVLTVYTFCLALQTDTPLPILAAALAIFCTFWAKYSTWILLSILPVIFLVYYKSDPQKTRRRAFYTITITLVLILPLVISLWEVINDQIRLLLDYQRPGLQKWSEGFISTFFFQIHPLVTLSALFGTWIALRKKDRKFIIPLYLIMVLVLVLQVKRIRYLMPIFPMLAITAAYGLRQLADQRLQRFLMLSTLGAALILTFGSYLPFTGQLSAANLKNGGRFLDTISPTSIAIYTVPQKAKDVNLKINVPILDLFTQKKLYLLSDPAEQSPEVNQTSSFRFSWEQDLPDFYDPLPARPANGPDPLVIISSGPLTKLPPLIREKMAGHRQVKSFNRSSGLFTYKTFVTIYYD